MIHFSIIIPTYNRSELLKRALLSVIAQEYNHWEVVVVDDGGNDDTATMIEGLADERIRYCWKENEERGIARNYGVQQAIGDYVFFLDSDDIIFPNHLVNASQHLVHLHHPEFFHARYQEWYDHKKVNSPALNPMNIRQKITEQNQFACQFFLRKDIALKFPFTADRNLKIGEDWLVILQVAARFPIHISNEYTSAIIHHGDRSMEVASSEEILSSRDIIIEVLKKDEAIPTKTLTNVHAELTSLAALAASISGKKKVSWRLLMKAIREKGNFILKKRTYATLKKLVVGK